MDLTRRNLLRTAVAGGLGVAGVTTFALQSPGFARAPGTTLSGTILRGAAGPGGYAGLVHGDPEPLLVRTDLGVVPSPGRDEVRTALLAFAHLTDVHVLDAQSPLRSEAADHYVDLNLGHQRASYRPQEMLTAHVADAMVRAVNQARYGPVTGHPLGFALQTGDNTDHPQLNEVRWNIDLLDGGRVRPDSGDRHRWEGVSSSDEHWWDPSFWHPAGAPGGVRPDLPTTLWGFPEVPGLLAAARRPFGAVGLQMPWYTAFGNHDVLVEGTMPPRAALEDVALGDRKLMGVPPHVTKDAFNAGFRRDLPRLLRRPQVAPYVREVTADPRRRLLSPREIVREHFHTTGTPVGHGFTDRNRHDGTAYYRFDRGPVRFVVLDTVEPDGGAQGSIDRAQLDWLRTTLKASRDRLVVVASHHTSRTMGSTGRDGTRVTGPQLVDLLLQHPQVIAWFNGHEHRNHVAAHPSPLGGLWEVGTASHVDWPQQSRLVEIADNHDGTLSVFATMLDHAGPTSYAGRLDDTTHLAALSRELAVNDWQLRNAGRRGRPESRNVELLVRKPRLRP